jgi:UDP-N-acetylglucosamine 2-epimerase
MKIYIASFNRASNGAISKLKNKMIKEELYTDDYKTADYILAVGDRKETFDFVLERYRENKKIIHLWAGESNTGIHDDVYRHAITLMSNVQLCTNDESKKVVKNLCKAVGKRYLTFTIGNIMLDNLKLDGSDIPKEHYILVLFNPEKTTKQTENELVEINEHIHVYTEVIGNIKHVIWIEPNGDNYSEVIEEYVNTKNLPREKFLGLLKNCKIFITNSSCQYYEAPYLIDKSKIISIGNRNKERNSKYSNMSILNASDNVIKVLRFLENAEI